MTKGRCGAAWMDTHTQYGMELRECCNRLGIANRVKDALREFLAGIKPGPRILLMVNSIRKAMALPREWSSTI